MFTCDRVCEDLVSMYKIVYYFSVRRSVSEWLELHRRPQTAERDKDMAARITILSRFLPEPVKAQEFLTKFSVHLLRDQALLQGMETIVRPDISCKECADTTVIINVYLQQHMYIVANFKIYNNTCTLLLILRENFHLDQDLNPGLQLYALILFLTELPR